MVNHVDYKVTAALSKGCITRPEPLKTARSTSEETQLPSPHLKLRHSLSDRDESDPVRCAAELVQRGCLILDVSVVDLEASESALGPFHPTTWHFPQ